MCKYSTRKKNSKSVKWAKNFNLNLKLNYFNISSLFFIVRILMVHFRPGIEINFFRENLFEIHKIKWNEKLSSIFLKFLDPVYLPNNLAVKSPPPKYSVKSLFFYILILNWTRIIKGQVLGENSLVNLMKNLILRSPMQNQISFYSPIRLPG